MRAMEALGEGKTAETIDRIQGLSKASPKSVLAGLALTVIVLGGSQLVGPRCGKYRITNDSIEFVLFGKLRVWRSFFEDIREIRLVSFSEMQTGLAIGLMNRPFAQYVLVRRRRGIFRAVVITPDQPQEFV